jgi:hypothetical protein
MKRMLWILLGVSSSLGLAASWDIRVGLASFPDQNLMLGVEVSRVFSVAPSTELSLGVVAHTDFSETVGPGAVGRLRTWLLDELAVGAVAEYGYLLHHNTNDPDSYGYAILGPLLGIKVKPIFVQWEPGLLLYRNTSKLMPFRILFGYFF